MKFIDAIGLKYFYNKLKDKFVQKSDKVSKENIYIYGITSYADLYKMFVSIGDENVPAIIAADNTSSPKHFIMSMYNNTSSDEDNGLHINKCCIMQICSNTEDGKIKSLSFKDDGIFTMTDNKVGKNTELFAANGTLFDITTKLDVTGGKVQGNLYADPEHCTDIADITDAEKNLMANYSVQWWLLNTFRVASKAVQLESDNKIAPIYLPDNYYQLTAREIPSSSWKTSTPFNVLDGVVTNIYKGETVGNYTKWILIPYANTENQKYTAYKKGNANYIYSNYAFDPNQPLLPWEFWLPSNLAVNTVEVDL